MVERRLVQLLERRACLPLEMVGPRAQLSAQDSNPDFTSDVECEHGSGTCVLAVFLDILQGFDRMSVDAITHHLTLRGVSNGLTRYFAH